MSAYSEAFKAIGHSLGEIFQESEVQAALVGVSGVFLGLTVNWLATRAQRRHVRNSVVTAIQSDIRSIVQALQMTELVMSFIKTHESSNESPVFPPWSDAPREENYFKLYEALAPQIGMIEPELAKEIVRFYTFLRISRDAAAPFASLRKTHTTKGDHKNHAANVLNALGEALMSAATVLSKRHSTRVGWLAKFFVRMFPSIPLKVNVGQDEALQLGKLINQAMASEVKQFRDSSREE